MNSVSLHVNPLSERSHDLKNTVIRKWKALLSGTVSIVTITNHQKLSGLIHDKCIIS